EVVRTKALDSEARGTGRRRETRGLGCGAGEIWRSARSRSQSPPDREDGTRVRGSPVVEPVARLDPVRRAHDRSGFWTSADGATGGTAFHLGSAAGHRADR